MYNYFVTRLKIALPAAALMVALVCAAAPASEETDSVEVTVTIGQILIVEYTGDPDVTFTLTAADLNEGSKQLPNQGNVNWWSNVAPWNIWIERTHWTPAVDIELQIKYGPPPPPPGQEHDNFQTIYTYPTIWVSGNSVGSGTYEGIDWKVRNFGWETAPGTYTCTVTFSIEPA